VRSGNIQSAVFYFIGELVFGTTFKMTNQQYNDPQLQRRCFDLTESAKLVLNFHFGIIFKQGIKKFVERVLQNLPPLHPIKIRKPLFAGKLNLVCFK